MFDEHDRHAFGGEFAEQGREHDGLSFVLSGRGFVEQEDLRLCRKATAQLDQTTLTGRQGIDPGVGNGAQTNPIDDVIDDRGRVVLLA